MEKEKVESYKQYYLQHTRQKIVKLFPYYFHKQYSLDADKTKDLTQDNQLIPEIKRLLPQVLSTAAQKCDNKELKNRSPEHKIAYVSWMTLSFLTTLHKKVPLLCLRLIDDLLMEEKDFPETVIDNFKALDTKIDDIPLLFKYCILDGARMAPVQYKLSEDALYKEIREKIIPLYSQQDNKEFILDKSFSVSSDKDLRSSQVIKLITPKIDSVFENILQEYKVKFNSNITEHNKLAYFIDRMLLFMTRLYRSSNVHYNALYTLLCKKLPKSIEKNLNDLTSEKFELFECLLFDNAVIKHNIQYIVHVIYKNSKSKNIQFLNMVCSAMHYLTQINADSVVEIILDIESIYLNKQTESESSPILFQTLSEILYMSKLILNSKLTCVIIEYITKYIFPKCQADALLDLYDLCVRVYTELPSSICSKDNLIYSACSIHRSLVLSMKSRNDWKEVTKQLENRHNQDIHLGDHRAQHRILYEAPYTKII